MTLDLVVVEARQEEMSRSWSESEGFSREKSKEVQSA